MVIDAHPADIQHLFCDECLEEVDEVLELAGRAANA
jgi:hypothetical protein